MTAPIRYLNDSDVRAVMPSMAEIVELVQETLVHHGAGLTQMPPKIDLAPGDDAFAHAMPGLIKPTGAMGMKWVSGYPQNKNRNVPYINGSILMNDVETGEVVGMLDASHVTAMRTAACAAVSARHLADPNSEVMTIIGCGVQGRAAIEALLCVFPDTERMLAFDIDVERQAQFADEVMTTFDLASIVPPEPREACEGAHVIVSSVPIVKKPNPFIEPDWLQTGTLCVPLDFDAAFTPASFHHADLLVTDDSAQYAHYKTKGHFVGCPDPGGDLGAVVSGKIKRPAGTPVVISVNLGLGILDVALGQVLLRRAIEQRVGTELKP